jgi:ATP-dependent DNA helicase RecG
VLRALVQQHLDALLPLVTEPPRRSLFARSGRATLQEALRRVLHRTDVRRSAFRGARVSHSKNCSASSCFIVVANQPSRGRLGGRAFLNRCVLTSQLRKTLPFKLTGSGAWDLRDRR